MKKAEIRVGIGGWSFAPWHETFYPSGTPKTKELEYASRHVTAIEINSTFYGPQKPTTYEKWRAQTPDNFIFSLKAPRVATHRRDLRESADSIRRFLENGPAQLQEKLGPIVWQLPPTKSFVAGEFEAFLASLPDRLEGRRLRHALDVRHASFGSEEVVTLARKHGAALIYSDAEGTPAIADATADFVYLRLRCAQSHIKTGYSIAALKHLAQAAKTWNSGGIPSGMTSFAEAASTTPRDTFVYFINGAKERAPAAAIHLIELLGAETHLSLTP